ncbi:MAG: bifunctional UDP-N-acetylmuramoyl-tripeptide:D-alanyl-D-alanine ligase/alanine racemase [Bacteroidales bacterium]
MKFSPEDIALITKGTLVGAASSLIGEIFTDSRTLPLSPGDSMFVALQGPRHDGHQYISDLYHAGIRLFMVSHIPEDVRDAKEAGFIVVRDCLKAMQQLAAYHRSLFHFPVIGITGSNGKTIVKEWIFQLLQSLREVVKSPRSYNSQVGVPLSLFQLRPDHEIALIEAGISYPGEMSILEELIQPGIGIITNIGEAHQENFTDLHEKVREKLILFRRSSTLLYCKDQKIVHEEIQKAFSGKGPRLLSWSFSPGADLEITGCKLLDGKTQLEARWKDEPIELEIPFTDKASIENCIHCLLLYLFLGIDKLAGLEPFSHLSPVAMRMELKTGINGCTLINDSYSSDMVSLGIALDFLQRQPQNPVKTLILSDILQSGKENDELYQEVGMLLLAKGVGRFIGIGPALKACRQYFQPESIFFDSTDEFIREFPSLSFRDEAILLKGARVFGFERITELLEQKRHQTRLEINLQSMVHNLNFFRSLLQPGTRVMGMVKALSYGSGTYEIANLLQYHKVDYLAVAVADEGIALRHAGIQLPMMVMSPEPSSFDAMVRFNLEPELYSLPLLRRFIHFALKAGLKQYPVHLKLDTGMHRLGFSMEEIPGLLEILGTNREIHVRSVFSHLAGSEDPDLDGFTREQIDLFIRLSKQIIQVTGYPVLRHILNSAGIERFPDAQLDMVRLGIGLYGISTVNQSKLLQVGTLRSIITQVKALNPGDTVGYNRKGLIVERSRIAVVPIGYADGLNRKLGNGNGCFLIKGKYAPIVGNICMDMCMINVTGMDVKEGDEVIIFGEGLSVTRLADQLGTIPYEVLTGISSRVKRVYYQE